MKTKKQDLVEIEFTANIKDGVVFDTTNKETAVKEGLTGEQVNKQFKPLKVFIGRGQVIKGFDNALEDKEIGKEYTIEISEKEGYGKRDPKLVRTIPSNAFEQPPQRGMFVNLNGMIARVISVTGGRVLVDMNNPLAGKDLVYKFKILKIINDDKEKLSALAESFMIKPEIKEDSEKKELKISIESKVPEPIKKKFETDCKELIKTKVILEVKK